MGRCGDLTFCVILLFYTSFNTGTETNSTSTVELLDSTLNTTDHQNKPTESPAKTLMERTTVKSTLATSQEIRRTTTESRSTGKIPSSSTARLEPSSALIKPTPSSSWRSEPILSTVKDRPAQARAHVDTPSALNIGDEESSGVSADPLLAGLLSAFVVVAAIASILLFLKFRNAHVGGPEFRPLQDLPMDDMMEDAPLSMYSY